MQRTKIVMKALQMGIPVKLGSWTYRLFKRGDVIKLPFNSDGVLENADHWLGMDITGNGEYHGAEMDIVDFITKCNQIPEEEIVGLAMNLGLNEMKKVR